MKYIFKLFWTLALVTVIGFSLPTCRSNNGNGDNTGNNGVNSSEGDTMVDSVMVGEGTQFFNAEILTIKRNPYYAIVKPLEGEAILAIADQIFFDTYNLGDGGFQVGDYITVQYTGTVNISYPAGIDAVSWSVYCEIKPNQE